MQALSLRADPNYDADTALGYLQQQVTRLKYLPVLHASSNSQSHQYLHFCQPKDFPTLRINFEDVDSLNM